MDDFFVKWDPLARLRDKLKAIVPQWMYPAFRVAHKVSLRCANLPGEIKSLIAPPALPGLSYFARGSFAYRVGRVSRHVRCAHNPEQILRVCRHLLTMREAEGTCLVEAGSFKGGSAAKFSIAAALTGRELHVFDSFEGIPDNVEEHEKGLWGQELEGAFAQGAYAGALAEVVANINRYGEPRVCRFHKGWFEQTMPDFRQAVAVAYIDVDLASSTRTCLKYLYPLVVRGGALFSQDGHIPLVVNVLQSDEFWEQEVGVRKPRMEGLGTDPLVTVFKD